MVQLVTKDNLGADFVVDTEIGKIKVNIDDVTIKSDAVTGRLYVPSDMLGGVSADDGQLLTVGSDGKAYVDAEAVQDAIGQAIANGAGITYDDAMDAIKVAMGNMTVVDTDSVDLTLDMTTDPDKPALKAELRVDASVADNLLSVGSGGVSVSSAAVGASLKGSFEAKHGVVFAGGEPLFRLTYFGDKEADAPLEEVQDAFGAGLGLYVLKG